MMMYRKRVKRDAEREREWESEGVCERWAARDDWERVMCRCRRIA